MRTIVAGLTSTLAMTMVMVMAPVMGMPKMDIAAMLGSVIAGGSAPPGSFAWIAGLVMHLIIGSVVLSAGYALAHNHLPTSSSLVKGAIYGAIVWLMAQAVVMPMMGAGLFSSNLPHGAMSAMGSLIGHLIYGAVLGKVYGSARSENTKGNLSILPN
ncbi:MAG TPA: DUF6789 family protein [Blastocatellia bacterium]|nr:DUF6789 family protein [Blastocatellia bacterium]